MISFLLWIKHRVPIVWKMFEFANAVLFQLLHGEKLRTQAKDAFSEFPLDGFLFRVMESGDLQSLYNLIHRQRQDRLTYFRPHGFEMRDLEKAFRNRALLMFGVFYQDKLVGYFFLRCFWNRKCFVGRLIDEPYEKRGIGRVMNQIMYHTAWRSGFRCFTTVSQSNDLVMRSHRNSPVAKVLKQLPNDYLLIEFVQPATKPL